MATDITLGRSKSQPGLSSAIIHDPDGLTADNPCILSDDESYSGSDENIALSSRSKSLSQPPQAVTEEERTRRISIHHQKTPVVTYKEGQLLKQTRVLGKWAKCHCSVEGNNLFIAKRKDDKIREDILLKDVKIIENSTQNINNSFTVMTPEGSVILAAGSRKEMEEWITSINLSVQKADYSMIVDNGHHLNGDHSWFLCTHSRPVYCNVCGESFHGVAGWRGLSCEVCKFKSHRRCVFNVKQCCKWTNRSNLISEGLDTLPDLTFPHQWLEGNLPSGSKCIVCKKTCGSTKRLQDFRCMCCKSAIHTDCMSLVKPICDMGTLRMSILPPTAVQRSHDIIDGMWEVSEVIQVGGVTPRPYH
jgi:diacylglycerol kinase (ATP)